VHQQGSEEKMRSSKPEAIIDRDRNTCTADDHRPCELAVTVNFARDLSEESGTPIPPKLAKILDTKRVSESQVRAALEEWRYTVPKAQRKEADDIVVACFPEAGMRKREGKTSEKADRFSKVRR